MSIDPTPVSGALLRCPLCGEHDAAPWLEKDGFRVVRCRRCNLAHVNPRLGATEQAELYRSQAISPTDYYVRTATQDAISFAARLRWLETFVRPGALLDLGCGPGTFSSAARARGWSTVGVELNPRSVAECRSAGLEVLCEEFPSASLAGRRFDAVVMNDFLEHLGDPVGALREARRLLAPGGVLFVTTPDVGSLLARVAAGRWLHLKPNEHLVYFDRRTLAAALERAGFRVEALRSMGRVRNLGVALEKLRAYGELPARVLAVLIPPALAGRINLPINPGDEMAAIARPVA